MNWKQLLGGLIGAMLIHAVAYAQGFAVDKNQVTPKALSRISRTDARLG